ncbi:MAG: DUF3291 domain-containing protein, partial [Burkholderiales bacterium]|nr:DUF3291 domain-containing protein [Anaerolineae bacterium]
MPNEYHLAQVNIGRILGPMDGPIMADFAAWLDPINAIADKAPGFVWRLQTEAGDATALRVFGEEWMLINMSVWESVDNLFHYVYASEHVDVMRRRSEWFERLQEAFMALWWIPAGHIPTPEEAEAKITYLREHGPTPLSFTFKKRFTVEEMLAMVTE